MHKESKTINFYTSDQQVIAWWDSIKTRDRSATLCDLIRAELAPKPETLIERLAAVDKELKAILKGMR